MQKNSLPLQVVITTAGGVIGVFFAWLLLPVNLLGRYSLGDFLRELIVLSTGAVVGALLFSWASKR